MHTRRPAWTSTPLPVLLIGLALLAADGFSHGDETKEDREQEISRLWGQASQLYRQGKIAEDLTIKEQPLRAVLTAFEKRHGITIHLDADLLRGAGIGPNSPVTLRKGGVSVRSALKQMLGDVGLTYVIIKGELWVRTLEQAE